MELNTKYKQLQLGQFEKTHDTIKGKVVDKVWFYNRGYADENIFIITFTDNTFIAIGADTSRYTNYENEPSLENFIIINPRNYHSLDRFVHLDDNGNPVLYDSFVKILVDLGLWNVTAEELQAWKEKHERDEEEREYKNYLRLKEKFEKIGV